MTGTAVTSVMSTNNGDQFGTFNFSADLTQLVQQTSTNPEVGIDPQVRLLNFDAATGEVTEKFTWNLPTGTGTGNQGYSADFSPNGDHVYATKIFGTGHLFRYRIAGAETVDDITRSVEDLGAIGSNGGQVRRAPDRRMYVANNGGTSLSVVNDPDAIGPGLRVRRVPPGPGHRKQIRAPPDRGVRVALERYGFPFRTVESGLR